VSEFNGFAGKDCELFWITRVTKNSKSQIANIKWFDKLTTLSLVEGQITMTKIQNSKPVLVI
jgi:hypothetical protein